MCIRDRGYTFHYRHCQCNCHLKCTVRDGRMVLVEPNEWPDKRNETICLKGISDVYKRQPYEGVWRAADDGVRALLLVNPHSMEVERFMRSCGLGRPEGTNEPLDHVATECELLEHLALRAAGAEPPEGAPADADLPGGSPAAAYGAFLEEHARAWMPRFAEAVAAESRVPFYRDAAAFLGAIVAQ